MKQITLENGFEVSIQDEVMDDAELLELLVDVEDKPQLAVKILGALIGEKQKKALYEKLRGENGRVRATDAFNCVKQILNGANEKTKN